MVARRGDPAQAPTRAGAVCGSPKKSGGTCRNRAGKGTHHGDPHGRGREPRRPRSNDMTRKPPAKTCGAKTRSEDGHPCARPAGWGTPYSEGSCRLHGGATPSGQRSAQKLTALAAVRTFGLPLEDGDPDTILLAEVRRSAGIVTWLETQIGELAAGDVIRGTRYVRKVDTTAGAFPGSTTTSEAGPAEHLWSQLYARERRHLADVCAKAISAGVARRHVELAEDQGALAGQLVSAVLRDLGVDPGSARAREVIGRHFTLLAGGAA